MWKWKRNKIGIGLAISALALLLAATFFSCEQSSPLGVDEPVSNATTLAKGSDNAEGGHAWLGRIFDQISDITVLGEVTPKNGGRLLIRRLPEPGTKGSGNQGHGKSGEAGVIPLEFQSKSRVTVSLNVLPHSVDTDMTLSMTLGGGSIDLDFGPDGTVFNRPAKLNIFAKGLNLSNVNTETLDIYYFNPETEDWEKIQREWIYINKRRGTVQVRNACIPHFSRYALAWSN